MHPFDIIITISIACCIGFTPAIYVKRDPVLAAGYFVASTAGAFAGSFAALWYAPSYGKPGSLALGIAGAVVLVAAWHLYARHRDCGERG